MLVLVLALLLMLMLTLPLLLWRLVLMAVLVAVLLPVVVVLLVLKVRRFCSLDPQEGCSDLTGLCASHSQTAITPTPTLSLSLPVSLPSPSPVFDVLLRGTLARNPALACILTFLPVSAHKCHPCRVSACLPSSPPRPPPPAE